LSPPEKSTSRRRRWIVTADLKQAPAAPRQLPSGYVHSALGLATPTGANTPMARRNSDSLWHKSARACNSLVLASVKAVWLDKTSSWVLPPA
jgi:hypothetical protein